MGAFCVFIILLSFGLFRLPESLAITALPLHQACATRFAEGEFATLYSALVCGSSLPKDEIYETFKRTGLLHLVVVSGSHLVWLELALTHVTSRLISQARWRILIIGGALVAFTLMAGLQAPVVRAALSWALKRSSERWALGYTALHRTFLSGLFCLALFPKWLFSLSLLLSWAAALALASRPKNASALATQTWIYLTLFLCLGALAAPHPLTILCNLLLGPIVAFILFPVSVLTFLIPALSLVTQPSITRLISVFQVLGSFIPSSFSPLPIPTFFLWLYVLGLQIHWLHKQILLRRNA